MGVMEAAAVVLGNPFEPVRERAAAEVEVARASLDGFAPKEARRLALAKLIVDPVAVSERRLAELGTPRAAAAAAARVTAALELLAGESEPMRRVRAQAWQACFGESVYEAIRLRPLIREHNVLVLGETGTGKELVAQAIAAADPEPARAQAVNAAAIPRELLEAELFGHVKGAFTGAVADREGKIIAAEGGTLFLDELADLPAELQAKLLRVVEDDNVTPLGSNRPRKVDVRYVGATSQPLEALVERGAFRRDLYQRLAGTTIAIPPLRERPEDLVAIGDALFARNGARLGGAQDGGESTAHISRLTAVQARFRAWLATPEARARPWNGNVRELQSLMRSWILGDRGRGGGASPTPAAARGVTLDDAPAAVAVTRFLEAQASLREVEDWYILRVMETVGHRHRKAAEILGIDRGTLARRLKQIDPT
jgi:transcriptional regulator with PAS, ATPase and Fis domain